MKLFHTILVFFKERLPLIPLGAANEGKCNFAPLSYIIDKLKHNTCSTIQKTQCLLYLSYQKLLLTTYLVFTQGHSSIQSLILLLKRFKTVQCVDQTITE